MKIRQSSAHGVTITAQGQQTTIVHKENAADLLGQKTEQLHGLMSMTTGEQGTAFRMLSDSIQEAILWAATDLARDIHILAQVSMEVGA